MKSKFKLAIALLILSTAFATAAGSEFTKQYRKGWLRSEVNSLEINNKFGEVKINDMGGDSMTIKVLITINNASSGKAKELLEKIRIQFDKTGSLVRAETQIEEGFRNNESFSIDYLVNIPKDRNLSITNKYGNLILNDLEAKGQFEVSYGSMTAGKMKAPAGSPVKISLSYGKADLETINEAEIEIKYSKLNADEIEHLTLDTKYSTLTLHKTANMSLDSKYDAINIDELGKLKSQSRYTNYKISELSGDFELDNGYGSVRISKVDPKFGQIRITSSYGGINLGLNNLNYKLKADCEYCDINFPEERYKGNRIKDNHTYSLDGNVGNGGGSVTITSRYGGVKLTE